MKPDQPMPWHCQECGARLQWRRESVDCPTHGVLAKLPKWPDLDTADVGGVLSR